jgi:hypothetical protein
VLLTDPDTKDTMLQLGQADARLARAATACGGAQDSR